MEKENTKEKVIERERLNSLKSILSLLQVQQSVLFGTHTMYVFLYAHEDCISISASFLYGENEITSVNISSCDDIDSQDKKYEKFLEEIYPILNV